MKNCPAVSHHLWCSNKSIYILTTNCSQLQYQWWNFMRFVGLHGFANKNRHWNFFFYHQVLPTLASLPMWRKVPKCIQVTCQQLKVHGNINISCGFFLASNFYGTCSWVHHTLQILMLLFCVTLSVFLYYMAGQNCFQSERDVQFWIAHERIIVGRSVKIEN